MSDNIQKEVACPTCKKENPWTEENAFRPFCSERCRLIDLGEWANESYAIPAQNQQADLDDV